jgi:hypothetical protein
MRIVSLMIAVASVTAAAGEGRAVACGAGLSCLRLRTQRAVPENPSFIVSRAWLRELPDNAKVADISQDFVRVTFVARAGDVVNIPGVYAGCETGPSFRVTNVKPTAARVGIASATQTASSFLDLELIRERAAWWTRIDWAYSEADLEAGLARTEFTKAGATRHVLEVADGEPNVFVRLTTESTAGPGAVWTGWIHVERGASEHGEIPAQFGTGALPAALAATPATKCATVPDLRAVPASPRFFPGSRDLVARTLDGARLPMGFAAERYEVSVRVDAPEGTVFDLEELPVRHCFLGEHMIAYAPTALAMTPRVTATADRLDDWFYASVDVTGTWGLLRTEWALAPNELGSGKNVQISANRFYITQTDLPLDFQRVYLRITPLWDDREGAAWEGTLDRAGNLVEIVHARPSTISKIAYPDRLISTCREGSHRASSSWSSIVAGLLLAGLLLTLRARAAAETAA